ncbi:MAG: hypothetical protein U0W40_19930 [Acidimicrobiia bacterium]
MSAPDPNAITRPSARLGELGEAREERADDQRRLAQAAQESGFQQGQGLALLVRVSFRPGDYGREVRLDD